MMVWLLTLRSQLCKATELRGGKNSKMLLSKAKKHLGFAQANFELSLLPSRKAVPAHSS